MVYPYKTLSGDVELVLSDVQTDGNPARGAFRDPEGLDVDLSNLERAAWATATLSVEVVGPPTELSERRNGGGAPVAHVLAQCGFTNVRQSFPLTEDPDTGRWIGVIRLDRDFWFGRVNVAAYISDRVEAHDYRLIGSAAQWQILLDDLPRSPVHGALSVIWKNFDLADVEPTFISRAKGEPYYHFLDPNEPVLYLNSAFPGLEPLLRDRTSRRTAAEQALHDQVRVGIASKFLVAAANTALANVRKEEGEPAQWPESPWQMELLQALLHRAYLKRASDDALEEVLALMRSENGAGSVQNLLISAVDQQIGANRLLKLSIKNLGLEPDSEPQTEED
jgi:hypothetical protein